MMNIWEFKGGNDSNAPQCYVMPTILTTVFSSAQNMVLGFKPVSNWSTYTSFCGAGEELACLLLAVSVSTDCINCCTEDKVIIIMLRSVKLFPVAARFKAWVCDSLLGGNAGSNLRSARCMVIHDLLPANTRLHRLRLVDTDNCRHCGRQDTTLHRLTTDCGVGREVISELTRTQIAWMHRTGPRRVLTKWLLRSCFKLWPRQKQQATFCLWANMVFCLVHKRRTISLLVYMVFMRRTRWKTYQEEHGTKVLGNYLEVL